ncbi:MAG: hemin ABC transporter substrate-binding protein [Deltaproteobacteria bacterium]|nr:hemin ABC transporter substrate-binding protein [Deltaproteobacteria bacterium]HCH64712.1 hemin ABC transporter substrate-binding protein [Deltaproteobacteria bacterium]
MLAAFTFALLCTAQSWAGSIVDSTGATVESKDPQRVITIAGNVSETVFALGLGDKVVAVDASSLFPAKTQELPKVGYYRNINAEGVLSQSPDLIVTTDAAGPPEVLEQLRGSGIPIAVLSAAQTMEAAQKRITQIGALLDRTDEAKVLTDKMASQLAAVVKPETPPKVLFIYARGAGTLNVAGTDTSADAMISLAGGTNAVTGYEGYKPMSAEAIIEAAPDFLLFTTRGLESLGGPEGVAKLIAIEQTPAGKKQQIIAVDDLVLLGFGPRTGEGVQELSEKLQP